MLPNDWLFVILKGRKKKTETESENEMSFYSIDHWGYPTVVWLFVQITYMHVLINIDSLRKNALNQAGNGFLRAPVSTVHWRTCWNPETPLRKNLKDAKLRFRGENYKTLFEITFVLGIDTFDLIWTRYKY